MTVIDFRTRREQTPPQKRRNPHIVLLKAGLSMWLTPWLFWLTVIDHMDD